MTIKTDRLRKLLREAPAGAVGIRLGPYTVSLDAVEGYLDEPRRREAEEAAARHQAWMRSVAETGMRSPRPLDSVEEFFEVEINPHAVARGGDVFAVPLRPPDGRNRPLAARLFEDVSPPPVAPATPRKLRAAPKAAPLIAWLDRQSEKTRKSSPNRLADLYLAENPTAQVSKRYCCTVFKSPERYRR